jgi:hypothetical protein
MTEAPVNNILKLFSAAIDALAYKTTVFVTGMNFKPSVIFVDWVGALPIRTNQVPFSVAR